MMVYARYTPTIMDGPVVRFYFGRKVGTHQDIFSRENVDDYSREISASRNGVMISGNSGLLTDLGSVEKICRTLHYALLVHEKIKAARDPHEIAKRGAGGVNEALEQVTGVVGAG
jgi:hypothetical protein